MADIFISYSQRYRELTQTLADQLENKGYSVWWDRELRGGQRFDDEIRTQLLAAKAVIVIWTPEASQSDYVRMEVGIAYAFGKLITARMPDFSVNDIPDVFKGLETVPVDDLDRILAALIVKRVSPASLREQALQALDETDEGVRKELSHWEASLRERGIFIQEHPGALSLTLRTDIGQPSGTINLATISNGLVYLSDCASQTIAKNNRNATADYLTKVATLLGQGAVVGRNKADAPINVKLHGNHPKLRTLLACKDKWLETMVEFRDSLLRSVS